MNEPFAYDQVDYPAHVHPQMHPSRLAAIARLHGIGAASPARCELLEVGCGDGLQLIVLAMAYPDSRFVGVDMSQAAIARGEAMRVALGLDNLQLQAADLMTWTGDARHFDYITAHGFYSWVPDVVRARLLALCNERLANTGIAYISYNALPGCHLRRMLWDMLKFHVRDIQDPREKVTKAQAFLAWLGQDMLTAKTYAEVVRTEALDLLKRTDTSVLFHDDMAEINQPFSITEFATQASAHGLRFLAEADYHEMSDASAPPDAVARLAELAGDDVVHKEQYLDFLKGRRFRQTLLCRDTASLERPPVADSTLGMDVIGHLRADIDAAASADVGAGIAMRFVSADGAALVTDHPVIKAALLAIGDAFPAPLAVNALLDHARTRCTSVASRHDDAMALARALVWGFELGLLTLHCDAPRFAVLPGERPSASALARLQVEAGQEMVASLRPSMVRVDSRLALELIRLLDGKRDRAAILDDLALRMAELPIPGDDGRSTWQTAGWWQQQLASTLDDGLRQTARMALLVDD